MHVTKFRTWQGFRDELLALSSRVSAREERLIFRGQADSRWTVRTTLDRHRSFETDLKRDEYYQRLLEEFQREAIVVEADPQRLSKRKDALDLLARHHGLPSPVLDWTESPYVASFFAFEEATRTGKGSVAVWVLDRTRLSEGGVMIEIIDDVELLQYNPRALRQQEVFLRIRSGLRPLEEIIPDALRKLEVPRGARTAAVCDLAAMTITASSLFPDLDGAARTSAHRVGLEFGV